MAWPTMQVVATLPTSGAEGWAATGATNMNGTARLTRAPPSRLYETLLIDLSLRDSHPEPKIDVAGSPPTAARRALTTPCALYYLPPPS